MNLSYGCMVLPGTYDRENGLSVDADVNITWGGAGDFNLFAFYDPFADNIVHCVSAGVIHGYNFGVFPAGSDNPEDLLDSSINGTLIVRNTVPTTMPANQWFHVRAEIHRDGLVRILLNGRETMRMINSDHTHGFLVMRTWGDVYVDNVVVNALNENVCGAGCAWSSGASLLTPRALGASGTGTVRGKTTVVGHHDGNPGSGTVNEEYDPATNSWAHKTPYPRGEGRQALNHDAVIGDDMYFFGGANIFNNYHTQTVDRYNPVTDTWTLDVGTYPLRVANVGTAAYGGSIYCFGGEDYNSPPYSAAFRFNPATGTFTSLQSMPLGRSQGKTFVRNNKIWVAGGYAYPATFFDTIDIYDPATDTWQTGPTLPIKGYLYWAGYLRDGNLYAVYEEQSRPVIYQRNEASGAWSRLCDSPQSTTNFGVFAGEDGVHIIGGATAGGTFQTLHEIVASAARNTQPPAISAPSDVTRSTATSGESCSVVVSDVDLGTAAAADPCGLVTVVRSGVPAGNNFPLGSTTVTYTATNQAGLTSSATQTITILDGTPPSITAPANITRATASDAASCSVVISDAVLGSPQSSDACGSVTVVRTGVPAGNVFPLGSTTITYTATDGAGLTSLATQTVTVLDGTPPSITSPANITRATAHDAGSCSVVISDADLGSAQGSDACGAVTMVRTGVPSGNVFPLGSTTITYTATDGAGLRSSATQTVTVLDGTPPSIIGAGVSQSILWPPNHAMIAVHVNYDVTDGCAAASPLTILSVTSNEPSDGLGDGDTAPDWEIIDAHNVKLRAERSGTGPGRVYSLTVAARDAAGNVSEQILTVSVPHDRN